MRSDKRSMIYLASRDINPLDVIALSTKGFLIHLCLFMSSEKYLLKSEVRESKCE